MKAIETNKGTFKVRYVYLNQKTLINTIVILDKKNEMPFTGTYGDEIPMMETYKKQYDIKVKN